MASGGWRLSSSSWSLQARLAALLPDLLVFGKARGPGPELTTVQGVLLGVHVTGLTALMDKFSLTCNADHSMDKMAHIFSCYIGDIVEHILCFGGDILNITGNALLALWTVEQNQLSDIITLVVKCSLEIQEKFGICHTKEGQDLQIRIGLSAGHISQVVVGDEQRQYLLVIGRNVDDVQMAQHLAQANEIILSWNCWKLCEQYMFEVEIMREPKVVKLRDMRIIDPFDFDEHFEKCIDYLPHYPTNNVYLRNAVALDPNPRLEQTLQRHIMGNFLKKISEGQPVEYLSELRTVTMVLINLKFHKKAWMLRSCQLIHETALYISTAIKNGGGQLNQIFMFGQGCTFFSIFGLPGDKKPDECAHALESSYSIFSFCWENLAETKLVSIGITNGPVFCGVIGALARHEFTVIGPKVGLVARMVIAYPGLVSCDEVTYLRSMLPNNNFKKLPEKKMKNITKPGKIYEYLGHRSCVMFGKRHLARNRSELHPLLGREKELEAFQMALRKCVQQKEGQAVLYEGAKGYGKSQLLAEIDYLAQKEGHRVLAMELKKTDAGQCFYAIQTLMAIFFEIDLCPPHDRQQLLRSRLCGVVEEPLHCIFNDLFFVKFPLSFIVSHMDDLDRQKKIKACLIQLLQEAVKEESLIFLIDEAQYIDIASWEFLVTLLSSVPVVMVMALSSTSALCNLAQNFVQSPQAAYVSVPILVPSLLLEMVCQDLGVVSIPRELQIYFLQRSFGVPLYCEVLRQSLLSWEVLLFHVLQKEEEEDSKWEMLTTNATKSAMYKVSPTSSEEELYICTVREDVNLDTLFLPPLLKEIAVIQLDGLTPAQQMLVKCAAIIGRMFPTDLLQRLLPGWTKKKMEQVLRSLMELRVLCLVSKSQETAPGSALTPCLIPLIVQAEKQKWKLDVSPTTALRMQEELSSSPLAVLQFGVPLLREAAWELWPKEKQATLHLECARFLQDWACRCESCSGGDFVPFHRFAIGPVQNSFATSWFCRAQNSSSQLREGILTKLQKPSTQENFQFDKKSFRNQDRLRTEQEFLDHVNRMKAQASNKKEVLNVEPCQCGAILELVLSPLTQHCIIIEDSASAFYYLLEAAAASLYMADNYMAFFYLKKATSLLGQSSAFSFLKKPKLKISQFEEATFCSLRAEVCFNMGQITLAKKLARQALQLLKRNFPRTWLGMIFQSFLEKYRHSTSQRQAPLNRNTKVCQPPPPPPHNSEKKLAVLQQRVRCLSLLWRLYSLETTASSRRFSRLAALMQMNSAEEFVNQTQIISAYVDFSQFSQRMGYKEEWQCYELLAIQRSTQCTVSREGLLLTAQLLQALAYSKLCLGHLDLSIHLGYQAHAMCKQLRKPALEYLVLSVLFKSAFLKNKYGLCVHVLESQWELISQSDSILGLACFYSSCLDLLLYGEGLLCRPFGECLRFIQQYEHSCILSSRSNVMLGVHSSLAMWFARHRQWDQFEHSFSKARRLVDRTNASLFGTHGFVRFLECQVMALQKITEDASKHIPKTRIQTLKYFKEFFSRCSTSPVYHSWVHNLKASVSLSGHEGTGAVPLATVFRLNNTCLTTTQVKEAWMDMSIPSQRSLSLLEFGKVDGAQEKKNKPRTPEYVLNKDGQEVQECILKHTSL
ncbi:adenylate cyclase type 10-like isoform X4 [Phascolarctos cinereus]|uniref:Adenylate cyclase type 10-like isoform X4 n=1 Tax=Phascolarctos cinereus TaxID=38626 RepID=A0A6P5LEK2_PHACI|nr:adenylate cyclase type 10-like isoform X4 [Phascolarctos cinereus]